MIRVTILIAYWLVLSLTSGQGQNELDLPGSYRKNAITLGFVFDITGSMWDDLKQVITGAEKILETILQRKDEELMINYILVPFHDPDIGPVTVTSDPEQFLGQLKKLHVHGGGDCPEMSIGAIKLALDHSNSNSFLYVFTDARAKDYYLTEEVLRLVQAKETQVVFVMTGDCGDQKHPGFKAYNKIASTSSGQVFHLKKSDVNEVLEFVRASFQAHKVNLLAVDRARGPGPDIVFNVDSGLSEFTVSSAGDNPKVLLIDPKGNEASNGLSVLLSLKNVQIVNLKEPLPGPWTLRVESAGPHSVRSKGLSELDFVHGFSIQPVDAMGETKAHPITGENTYVLVKAVAANSRVRFDKIEFLEISGETITESLLRHLPQNPGTYRSDPLGTPKEYFYIKLTGLDEEGHPFQRITPTAIGSKLPDIPEVSTPSLVTASQDKTVDLNCTIYSGVPFSVQWFREDAPVSRLERFQSTSVLPLSLGRVDSKFRGMWTCKASNNGGSSFSTVYLDVRDEEPPVIIEAKNVTAIPGEDATLTCSTRPTKYPLNVIWNRMGHQNRATDTKKFSQLTNNDYVIRRVTEDDVGWYSCTVQSSGGRAAARLFLNIANTAKVEIIPPSLTYVYGERIILRCLTSGNPPLTVQWVASDRFRKPLQDGRMRLDSDHLFIENASPEDEGLYECQAVGTGGLSLTASASLKYSEIPEIVVPSRSLNVNPGDSASLRCVGEGIPDPTIRWFKGQREFIGVGDRFQVLNEGYFRILDSREEDTGSYRCVATNVVGSTEETLFLQVGEPPSIPSIENSDAVDTVKVNQGGKLTLKCQVRGHPKPEVTWTMNGQTLPGKGGPDLELDFVTVNNGGRYSCHAKNNAGVREKDFQVSVLVPPKFLDTQVVPFTVKVITLGETVEFHCDVRGIPFPVINWFKNGEILLDNVESNVKMSSDKRKLTIDDVVGRHAGNYTCVAENEAGKIKKVTNLKVLVPPSMKRKGAKRVVVKEGDTMSLECQANGMPTPDIHWLRNGQFLPRSEYGKLVISDVKAYQKGKYICMATNVAGRDQREFIVEVLVPPKRKDLNTPSNKDVRVLLNEPLLLTCDIEGYPSPVITWFKDEFLLEFYPKTVYHLSDDGRQLNVPSVGHDIEGNYSCYAQNNAGDDKINFNVLVIVPPHIDEKVAKIIVTQAEGKDVELECPIIARPFPGVTWLKDGHLFRETSSGGKLKLTVLSKDMGGKYICIVGNEGGNMEHEIELKIAVPPKVKEDESTPSRITSVLHRSVTIVCHVVSQPPPTIVWSKDGVVLDHALDPNLSFSSDGRQLKLKHARLFDEGVYTCAGTNMVGTTTKDVLLEVNVPPSIGETETQIFINSDNSVELVCPVSGQPNPSIVWMKNGHLIKDQEDSPLGFRFLQSRQTLLINRVLIDHAGIYTCLASNVAGKAEKHYTLSVLVQPSIAEPKYENISVQVGHPLVLKCEATGTPLPRVTWTKDGVILGEDEEYGFLLSEDRGKQLQVLNAEKEDGGEYVCEAENAAGSDSKTFMVHVTIPPLILKNNTTESLVTVNSRVLLECISQGEPQPNLTWMKNGEVLDDEDLGDQAIDLLRRKQVLEIKQAFVNHNGVYTCLAENDAGIDQQDFLLKVFGQPRFTSKSPANLTVTAGERTILNCLVDAEPSATVTWKKNGKRLDTDLDPLLYLSHGGQTLNILHTRNEDSAMYECLAVNSVGMERWNISLQVNSPPVLEGQTGNNGIEVKYAIAGSNVDLECYFVGNPWPIITWRKNDLEVTAQDGFEIMADEQVVRINNVKVEDAGNYTCAAFSSAGYANKTIKLIVQVPPSILVALSDVSVVLGESVQLECHLSNSSRISKVTRIWSKNGQPLSSFDDPNIVLAEDGRLHILKARLHDSGIYNCMAINEAGSDRVNRNLRVVVPATIERSNYNPNPTAIYNQALTLSCEVDGSLPITIKWYKEGISLDEYQYTIYHGGQKLDLYLTDATEEGNYSCVVENEAGEDTLEYNVKLLDRPQMEPLTRERTFQTEILEGQSVTLNCPMKDDSPQSIITWYKDNVLLSRLKLPPNIVVSTDGLSLRVVRAQAPDAGSYQCVATNMAGEARSDILLDILVAPWFSENDSSISIGRNQTAILQCHANGNPEPFVSWIKDGQELNGSSNIEIGDTLLKLRNVDIEDEGMYSCIASNTAGIRSKNITVTVLFAPSVVGPPANVTVSQGSVAALDCPVDGQPTPKVLWYKDGKYIAVSENGESLLLHDVTSLNAGTYSCVGVNEGGEASNKVHLNVLVPATVHEVRVSNDWPSVVGSSIRIFCNASGVSIPDYTWTKNGIPLLEDSNHVVTNGGKYLLINDLKESDEAHYGCTASNELGQDDLEVFLDVLSSPSINNAKFRVSSVEGEPLTLECPATGDPQPTISWLKNEEPVISSDRINVTSGLLSFNALQISDEGIYICNAENQAGVTRKNISVEVLVPPAIANGSSPENLTSVEGPLTLRCVFYAKPVADVTWIRDESVIGTGETLLLDGDKFDEGTYICLASNIAGNSTYHIFLSINSPPRILGLNLINTIKAMQNDSVTLLCAVSGRPKPVLKWLKNGKPFFPVREDSVEISENGDEIFFNSLQASQAGNYTCLTENQVGKANASFLLDVFVPPTLQSTTRIVKGLLGQSVTLNCFAKGHPDPTVEWTKIVGVNTTRVVSKGATYIIDSASVNDEGIYICVARNDAGSAISEMELVVEVPPSIDIEEATFTVQTGYSILLPCQAHGKPQPIIHWKIDNGVLSDTAHLVFPNGSLLVQQAVPDDSGTYLCVAINDAGVHKARRYLQVQAPPKISYISDSVTYGNKGEDLSLSCKATGTPVPIISWQRTDGRELKFKTGGRFRSPKSGLLEIVLLEPDDMATYQCVAQNEVGVDVGYVQLVVHSPPAIEAERVKEKVILKGGQVALPCRAQGYPTPLISWTHNGILLKFPRHDMRLEASGDLTILSAELLHNGTYVCSAANAAGKQYQEVTLKVRIPPTISTLPRDMNISVGTEFLLTCEAIGVPVPKLSWLHNDQKLAIAGVREGKTELLVVKANKEDEGVYSCLASNDAGEKKATATVHVKSPPIMNPGTTVVKHHEGDTAILECTVVADPPPVIVWKKNENSVNDDVRMTVLLDGSLEIAKVKAEDAGQYICVAVNGYGRAEGLTMLDVSSQPRFTVEPQDQLIHEGSFASLDCMAIGSPKPVISWSKNGLPFKPELNSVISSNSTLQIFVVSTKDVGIYECEASNEFGTTSKRASIRVIVNGGWSSWGLWSTCSVSCGGGVMTHVRQCNNPVPSPGGRTCSGSSVENQECNLDPCPVHGGWSAWGSWSACSVTCNNGVKKRTRLCNNPQPKNGGRRCLGLSQQALTCLNAPCDDTPKLARGHLVGEINGEDIGLVVLNSNVTQQGDRRFVSAVLHNVSPTIGQRLETMLPLLSPVYWASASEEDDAKNGFKLTRGKFQRDSDVTFATGENLRVTYVGRGVDADKHLLVDVVITGRTPFLPSLGQGTTLLPYKETYIQTGPDTLHVESTRFHSIHGYNFPEAWKHTVHYDGSLGTMKNLVEELKVGDVESRYDTDSQSLRYSLSASISKGHPDCPDGFRLSEGHCKDVNECQEEPSLCSHGCTNIVGSYYCLCNTGFTLGPSGHTCQDIDECLRYPCTRNQVCENTVGSYECLIRCPIGYFRSDDGDNCIDIDECKNKSSCSHKCENTPGSYLCSCLPGYHLVGKSNCLDIDECRSRIAPCEQNCTNLPGSYSCDCLEGFRLLASGKCEDIDECSLNKDLCPPGQLCVNKRGGYICSCREGFAKDVNDTCEDIDECLIGSSKCHHSQICENRPGGYTCSCARGFQSFALGKPCLDINECVQNPPPCNFRCVNLVGDYECVCPPDQKRLANRKACIGMDQSESRFAELLAPTGHGSCPPGMRPFSTEGDCQDVDECLNAWLCQHECVNTLGSYKCYCPPGYRLGSDGSSCQDINECLELGIKCSSDQMCFNTKGGYKCVETPCPPSYQRDSLTNFCRLECELAPIACPPNSKYADTLAFKMVALSSGIEAYEDLVRLLVYDHEGFILNNAVFEIVENQSNVPFEIRPEAGVGILYSKMALDNDREYKMKVRAVSYDPLTRALKYTSQFVVYLSVSQFPY